MNKVSPSGVVPGAIETADYAPEATQYLTFKVSGYLMALPGQEILRVVATPPPNQGGLVKMGLVQLGQYSIQIIDLSELLEIEPIEPTGHVEDMEHTERIGHTDNSVSQLVSHRHSPYPDKPNRTKPNQNPPFLMVLQNVDKDLWGIALHEPPDLMEIPNYALKPIPPKQRQTRALRWVSHIVTYDLASNRQSLPILDLSELIGQTNFSLDHAAS